MRLSNIVCAVSMVWLLSACGTTPPPEPQGKWYPVNRLPEQTQAIPLNSAYVFYVTPMDGTLKSLLMRWTKDRGIPLQYGISMDYTLHAPVAQIRTSNMLDAVSQLSGFYNAQGIEIQASEGAIIVRPSNDRTGTERSD